MTADPVNLPALSALADQATDAPWSVRRLSGGSQEIHGPAHGQVAVCPEYDDDLWPDPVANAAFIAASRSAIPVLVEALTEQRKVIDRAPHNVWCASLPVGAYSCDCWKRGAFAHLDAAVTWEAE